VLDPLAAKIAQGAPVKRGKVKVTLPQLADNGNSVPIRIVVDSPMTAADHVKSIHLYSERNPVSNMANFYLGPRAGKAEIDSRVRLAGSQKVTAVAALSDGSFWYDAAPIVVTLSACLDES
jgi:sulfur-oxidizing protein SoxY